MKRRVVRNINNNNYAMLEKLVAYHEAGHAAAIYLNNRLKKLPPVFFKILLDNLQDGAVVSVLKDRDGLHGCTSRIKGGRLIHTLPSHTEDQNAIRFQFTDRYHPAFEADIVNLLVGPLAEAKYIARMDNEPFKIQLLTVQALNNYGGEADLALVHEYLQSYSDDQQVQNESLAHFLTQAFAFVDDPANWAAITQLAVHILACDKDEIACEEVATVLEQQYRARNRLI
ncbi:hypothetical protein [Methylovulum psychrotolerans]|uniref:Peptidase M41 domain-containing protein n=1 Tax=Methylovulum psychrotolerans TaxID=1704499 RepID=A0A2S5CGA8_9GAMM|nr:hypothetical protein [Methylovulum psychrotolerans]POZ49843.1 hypothetical protein AADEFJLK_04358 [Methylovulum psychrotolerans]